MHLCISFRFAHICNNIIFIINIRDTYVIYALKEPSLRRCLQFNIRSMQFFFILSRMWLRVCVSVYLQRCVRAIEFYRKKIVIV